ncbi:hypothetical protein BDQ17DRAFT_1392835 [Cyathus striatus]|nr:hypothetical protein BDQ17DRAFT_1392835 [Cyathus striatus]
MLSAVLLAALPLALVHAASALSLNIVHDHAHEIQRRLPTKTWYHDEDHPVHALFKRGETDGNNYPSVGSPAWSAPFPTLTPDSSALPQEWVNALNAAVSAGNIPNIPPSVPVPNNNPKYPNGLNPNSPTVCSATYKCRLPGDIWDVADGHFGVSFDDGPTDASPKLLNFLNQNNVIATHFMIGVAILQAPQQFAQIFNSSHDIAVHTWTHPYMTTLSNLDVVAQLGWTMELIRRSTGGRVPKYWRPPYGDSDIRVSAIAKQVFGLTTVLWNQDSEDWTLNSGGVTTPQGIQANMQKWLTGPKSPGLVILEHELSENTVDVFLAAFPLIGSNGWNMTSIVRLINTDGPNVYWNAQNSSSNDVVSADIIFSNSTSSGSTSATSTSQSASRYE